MASNENILSVRNNEGDKFSVAGGIYRIVISGEQTNGAFAIIEMNVPPNGGPGPHAHAGFQESFHILEGEVELQSEAGTLIAKKGDFVSIPLGGIIHRFRNKTDKPARLWCTVVPAGLDEFFREVGKPATNGEPIPASPPTPEQLEELNAIAKKYGQVLYAPDYFEQQHSKP